jgi:hypothetical protein
MHRYDPEAWRHAKRTGGEAGVWTYHPLAELLKTELRDPRANLLYRARGRRNGYTVLVEFRIDEAAER